MYLSRVCECLCLSAIAVVVVVVVVFFHYYYSMLATRDHMPFIDAVISISRPKKNEEEEYGK